MAFSMVPWWWKRKAQPDLHKRRRRSFMPRLEELEDRSLPSVLTVLNVNDSGPGSLRGEIALAQDSDTIKFSSKLAGKTITLTSGEIAFDVGLDIEGLGAGKLAISGNKTNRIFDIGQDASAVTIAGLTLKNGVNENGGAILDDGATLTLRSDTLSNNQAVLSPAEAGAGASGGALQVLGESTAGMAVTISNCRFTHDTVVGNQGGVAFGSFEEVGGVAQGGAIAVLAENSAGLVFTVSGTSFTNDSAMGGNGQDANADTSTAATGGGIAQGGAVWLDAGAAAQPLFFFSTDTFSKSTATGGAGGKGDSGSDGASGGEADGGALYYTADFAAAPSLSINTCTFASNTALGGAGGAGGAASIAAFAGAGGHGGTGGTGLGGGLYGDFQDSAAGSMNFTGDVFHANGARGGFGGAGGIGAVGGGGGVGGEGQGGGLFIDSSDSAAAAQLAITQSALTSNFAQGGTGGNGGDGVFIGGTGNTGGSGLGGGLMLSGGAGSAWTLDTDSIAFNVAGAGNGGNGGAGIDGGNGGDAGFAGGGGIVDTYVGVLQILHSTILDNTAQDGAGGSGGNGVNPGTHGNNSDTEGGGLLVISLNGTVFLSPDTQISGNQADIGADILMLP
jgi:hypothetical protein